MSPRQTDHTQMLELCTAHALGSLDPADAVLLEEHLRGGCEDCRGEIARGQNVVEELGKSLDPVTPPERAEARLMARINEPVVKPSRARGRRSWIALPLAASLAAGGIGVAWWEYREATRLAAENLDLKQFVDSQPQVFELEPTDYSPAAAGYVYVDLNDPLDSEDDEWKLYTDHLLPTGDGATYEAWLLSEGQVHHLGSVERDPEGHGFAVGSVPLFYGPATLQITLEKDPAVASPSGPVILRRQKLDLRRTLPPPED